MTVEMRQLRAEGTARAVLKPGDHPRGHEQMRMVRPTEVTRS